MRADIARQPDVLTARAVRAGEFAAAGAKYIAPGPGGRVIVSGCGDGIFAALAASAFARARGLDWRSVGALELTLDTPRLTKADRVICISMSGNVDRTVEAARAAEAAGAPLLALVNGGGGRLGEIAAAKLSLDLPDVAPFLCGTASYTATVAALQTIAAGAAGRSGDAGTVAAARDAQAKALAAAENLLPAVVARVPASVRLLSAGAELGTAQYGAAKLVELTRIPAWSADLEEFAHSQYWAMPTDSLVVVIAADATLARYASESCEALGELGVATLAIDTAATPVAAARFRVTLPALAPELAPLATALPLQLLAYHLAEATGLDPNTRMHLKGDELRFRVSRKLTRRSLIGTGH